MSALLILCPNVDFSFTFDSQLSAVMPAAMLDTGCSVPPDSGGMEMVDTPRKIIPDCIVVMGVSGCGKSLIGSRLARRINGDFIDADDLHPPENIDKMRASKPLTDDDRAPWLQRVGVTFGTAKGKRVIACSALKRKYRDAIRQAAGKHVYFVHLSGKKDVILGRMSRRKGHYMPTTLLDSRFGDLEPLETDELGKFIDISQSPAQILRRIESSL